LRCGLSGSEILVNTIGTQPSAPKWDHSR
jgi:hypothetical protein